jgi:putative ABC transport system permease protein
MGISCCLLSESSDFMHRLFPAGRPSIVLALLAGALALLVALYFVGKVPIRYNLRNLTVRWKTTLMAALAFTAVIALLTVMWAFVNGMQRLTDNSGRSENLLVLSDGAPDEAISNLDVGGLAEIENQPYVERKNGRPMASRETFLIVNQAIPNVRAGHPPRRFLQVRGIEDTQLSAYVHNMEVLPGGEWFSSAGVRAMPGRPGDDPSSAPTAIEAVLGEGAAREFGHDRTAEELRTAKNRDRLDVGDTFSLGNRTWIVAGILDSPTSTFNSEVWAKRSIVATTFGKDTYTTLVLRTPSEETAREFKEFLSDYKKVAVAAQVETDYYQSLSETNKQFSWAIGIIAVVMSIGGIFGVMNTMFAAISQRSQDIGVLRLLGYQRGHILVSFLLESLVIGLVGGLLGCALGSLCDGWSANSVVSSGAGGGKSVALRLTVDANILARCILLTLAMALLGGLAPSLRAMRMRALDALR